jgi:hypothetical protein
VKIDEKRILRVVDLLHVDYLIVEVTLLLLADVTDLS